MLRDVWNEESTHPPEIPKEEDFRPIMILSPLVKWLELRFAKGLQEYCSERMSHGQIGLVKGTELMFRS